MGARAHIAAFMQPARQPRRQACPLGGFEHKRGALGQRGGLPNCAGRSHPHTPFPTTYQQVCSLRLLHLANVLSLWVRLVRSATACNSGVRR